MYNVFDGGLQLRYSSNLIPKNAGRVYHNIDNASGALTPVKKATLTRYSSQYTHWHYYRHLDAICSFENKTSVAEYYKNIYVATEGHPLRVGRESCSLEPLGIDRAQGTIDFEKHSLTVADIELNTILTL